MGGGFDREVGESYTRPSCSPARAATKVSKTPETHRHYGIMCRKQIDGFDTNDAVV